MPLIMIEHEQHPHILEIVGLYELETEISQLSTGVSFNVINDYLVKNSHMKTYMCQEDKIQIVKDMQVDFPEIVSEYYNLLVSLFNTLNISIDASFPSEEEVETVLNDYIRPALAEHMGNIKMTYLKEGVVAFKLLGTCQGCAFSLVTLTSHVSRILGMFFPAILVIHIQNELIEIQ